MIKLGKGTKTYYLVAEAVHMGSMMIDIKLTDNESWAKSNTIIAKIKAENEEEAKIYFRVRDMTR